jgi:hypothetical protein
MVVYTGESALPIQVNKAPSDRTMPTTDISKRIPRSASVQYRCSVDNACSWSGYALLWTVPTVIPKRILKSMKGTLQHQIREKSVTTAHELV